MLEVSLFDPNRVAFDESFQARAVGDLRVVGSLLQHLQIEVLVLEHMGQLVREGDTVRVRAKKIKGAGDYDLVRKMRGSMPINGEPRAARPKAGPGCWA